MIDGIARVLVVDDSAYIRKVVRQILSRSPFVEVVGTARDGLEALEQVEQLKPDVITLDLMMPDMDGLAFLRAQMARRPIPVVIMSVADQQSEHVLAALEAGAVDFVQKPTALATERIFEVSSELIEKVKSAAGISRERLSSMLAPAPEMTSGPAELGRGLVDIVVIGISTGGPQALKALIPRLPADLPVPLAMVLHMPVGYTEMYARRLDELSQLRVVEAYEGLEVVPGVALLAQAGRHLTFQRGADGTVSAHLDPRPLDKPHRPSVDVLFQSAAEVFGQRTLGVVMTGMGSDGQQGAAWIKAQGGIIFTEAEDTCVVYGMPRSVVEAGLSDRSLRLDQIFQAILEVV
jgi:two-component system, chemotaxis family, protein-glutamate methylesterase/glutaminase